VLTPLGRNSGHPRENDHQYVGLVPIIADFFNGIDLGADKLPRMAYR
jgi:hypothetical protein